MTDFTKQRTEKRELWTEEIACCKGHHCVKKYMPCLKNNKTFDVITAKYCGIG